MPPSLIPKNCSSIRPSSSSPSSWNVGATRAAQQARSFSATNEARTRQRRTMFRWLSGPGANFNEPQPGSTVNYLGSYDLQKGALKRALRQVPGQPLPPPGVGDFRTFPRNDTFKSEMVTGDGLREAVWTKVMLQGFSVKEVSAELGIEMSRVGAIVRLKEVEKEWQRQVRFPEHHSTHIFHQSYEGLKTLYDDCTNRLVYKTSTWLQNTRMRASLNSVPSHLCQELFGLSIQANIQTRASVLSSHTLEQSCKCCLNTTLTILVHSSPSMTCRSTPQHNNRSSTLHQSQDTLLVKMPLVFLPTIFSQPTSAFHIRN